MADVSVSRVLRHRHERNVDVPNQLNKARKAHHKISNAEAQRAWRERLKKDPEKYKSFRMLDTQRVKLKRLNLSEEKIKQYNDTSRIRMARWREKQRNRGIDKQDKRKTLTRASSEKKKQEWRDDKRKQRENMTSQKKRRINERRRFLYAQKKAEKTRKKNCGEEKNLSGFGTSGAKRQAVHRTFCILPKNPDKFADVLASIIKTSTPRKKCALSKKCILSPQSKRRLDFYEECSSASKQKLLEIKSRRNKKDNRLRHIIHQAAVVKGRHKLHGMRNLGLSKKTLKKVAGYDDVLDICRKRRRDAIPEHEVEAVKNFFQQSDICRELPNPRQVKDGLPRKTLNGTLVKSYQMFKEQHHKIKMSYSKFVKCRPSNVYPANKTKFNQCLCEYCTNVEMKVTSLVRFCTANRLKPIAGDKYDASRMTLCPKTENYRKECIDRVCKECGISKLEETNEAKVLLNQHGMSDITWQCWAYDDVTKNVKGNEVTSRRMVQKVHTTSVRILLKALSSSLKDFSKHLFNAQWQCKQFEFLKSNIPEKFVLLCSDFGENYVCRHQDEAQSAHWSYEQVTLHPVVAYYRCPQCGVAMHESFVFVSDDHKHDYHAVHHFISITNKLLVAQGCVIETEVQFSDGAPSQYKSKTNFADMALCQEDFGFHTEKHFFGSRHGKGPCDGEIGVVKKCVISAVKNRKAIISNSKDFYNFVKNDMSLPKDGEHVHKKRTFIYIPDGEIDRNRDERLMNLKAVPNTRATHCFRPVAPYLISTRERSCFCDDCLHRQPPRQCANGNLTGKWSSHGIRKQMQIIDNREEIADVPVVTDRNSTLAIADQDLPSVVTDQEPLLVVEEHPQPVVSSQHDQDTRPDVTDPPPVVNFFQEAHITDLDSVGLCSIIDPDMKLEYSDDNFTVSIGGMISCLESAEKKGSPTPEFRPGQFVEACLASDNRQNPQIFVAEIKEVSNEEYLLHFMEQKDDKSHLYFWPNEDDLSWEPKTSIRRILPIPSLSSSSTSRKQLFYF